MVRSGRGIAPAVAAETTGVDGGGPCRAITSGRAAVGRCVARVGDRFPNARHLGGADAVGQVVHANALSFALSGWHEQEIAVPDHLILNRRVVCVAVRVVVHQLVENMHHVVAPFLACRPSRRRHAHCDAKDGCHLAARSPSRGRVVPHDAIHPAGHTAQQDAATTAAAGVSTYGRPARPLVIVAAADCGALRSVEPPAFAGLLASLGCSGACGQEEHRNREHPQLRHVGPCVPAHRAGWRSFVSGWHKRSGGAEF
eukprot:scaffold48849_cov57-Phaeocystis_antarctica.AAC.1